MSNNILKTPNYKAKPLYVAILLSQIVNLIPTLMGLVGIHGNMVISFINYLLMTISTGYLIRYIRINHIKTDIFQKIFLLWLLFLFVTAIPTIIDPYRNYLFLKQFLTYIMFLYTIPLFMIAEMDLCFIKQLFVFVFILLVFNLLLDVFFGGYEKEGYTFLAEGAIILLFTFPYHAPRKKIIIALTIGLVLVGMMIAARRNKVVYYGGAILLSFITIMFSNSNMGTGRKITYIVAVLLFAVGLYIFIDRFTLFFERVETGMDSREGIIDLFLEDFNSSPSDWIFGRGLYGQFYGGVLNTDNELGLRDGIENGYLYLILKGGWIWLGLLIIISLKAVYNGLFKSNNLLCKGFAMIILLYYLDMVGFGIPQTSMKYIMVFISIAGCNTEWLIQMQDSQLSKAIGLK